MSEPVPDPDDATRRQRDEMLAPLTSGLLRGAKRLLQKANGFRACVVGGQPTLRDGEPTGRLGGQLLRGPLATV